MFPIERGLLSLWISKPSFDVFVCSPDVWDVKGFSSRALYARTRPRTTPSYLDVWRLQHAADDYSIKLDHDEDCVNSYIPAIF